MLRNFLPAPVVDIFVPIALVLVALYVVKTYLLPPLWSKLEELGVWDQLVDRFGGEKFRQMQFTREITNLKKLGDLVGAAQLYEDAEWYEEAIETYQEAEEYVAAGALYEKLEHYEHAAEMYLQADDWKRAANTLAAAGHGREAAEIYEKNGQKIDAAKLYYEAEIFDRAAELYEQVSYHPQAAQAFEKMGEHLKAAELFESVGDLTSAAKCYEQSESLLQAANVYLRAEKKQEAATMFERGGDTLMAAKMFSEIGEESKASELFEKGGRFFEAGRLAHRQGDGERAIQLFQRIDPSDENYETATVLLSRLFLDKNMVSLAQEKLQRVLRDRPIGPQTLEHYYCLGLVYEKLGKREEAIETFRRVMAERYGYEDVEEKIARLSAPASAAQQAPAPSAPPADGAPRAAVASPAAPASAAPPAVGAARPPAAPAKPAPLATPPTTTAPTPIAPIAGAAATPSSAAKPATSRPATPPPAPSAGAAPSPPFKLLEELGRGLLGGTFKAVDTRNDRPVVVKFLKKDILQNAETVKRFVAEVKLARSFDQPNLVRLFGLTEMRGHKVVIMEFVEGRSLAAILSGDRRLNVKQAIVLLTNLCMALGYAHQRQVLHKDLKLTDVLIAKGGKLRLSGVGLGALRTPALGKGDGYAAPEFLAGNRADARTDIYSLGGLLFHGMSGLHPASPQAAASGPPPTLQKLVPGIPAELDQIIARCMAEEPDGRFRNVAELLAATHALKT